LHASHKYYEAVKEFKELGIKAEGISLDFKQMMRQKDATV
jgi:dihydrolipoamide dehydrogenase